MSEQVLLLGGPRHLKIEVVHEIRPHLKVAEMPKRELTASLCLGGVVTMPDIKIVTYHLHRWYWSDRSLLNVYSCIDDEYWMGEHIRIMGDQLRRLAPWFGPGRIDLAMEFEKLWQEVEAKLMNSDYALNRNRKFKGKV